MKFYLIFIIFITFLLSSIGNDDPIKYGNQYKERNQTISRVIFCVFLDKDLEIYTERLEEFFPEKAEL